MGKIDRSPRRLTRPTSSVGEAHGWVRGMAKKDPGQDFAASLITVDHPQCHDAPR